MNRVCLIAAARESLGTRFRHQGRSAQHGVDCVGLIIVAARSVGMALEDTLVYGRQPQPGDFFRYIERNQMVPVTSQRLGDVGLFDFGAGPQHAALFTQTGLIHAYAPARKVIEHGFRAPWPQQLCGVYRFPHFIKRPY